VTDAASPEATTKPLLRGVTHQVAFFVAAMAGSVLVWVAPGTTARWGAAVYVASLTLLFGVSALYHRLTWSPQARQRMRRLDHSAIFILIAGTYTPLCLLLERATSQVLLITIWTCAALGAFQALVWVRAPKWLVALLAIAMGWLGIMYLSELRTALGLATLLWLAAGGVLYSSGAVIYVLKRPDPWPRVFGYHEIFHALVIAAAVCHFVAVTMALMHYAS
jgi:hemolysin III